MIMLCLYLFCYEFVLTLPIDSLFFCEYINKRTKPTKTKAMEIQPTQLAHINIKSFPTIINKNIARFIYQGLGNRIHPPELQSGANEVKFSVCEERAIAFIATISQFHTLFPRNSGMKKNLLASQIIRTPPPKSRLKIIH